MREDGRRATGAADEDDADEVLLRRFVAGESAAFAELVERHADVVFAICWRFFRNDADAQDAAQETFVALHRGARSFTGSARFSTWLYRVSTNTCHDLLRKRVRRPQSADVDPAWLPGAAQDEIGAVELDLDLRRALGALRPEHREVVVLHSLVGLTYTEIAERTGVALGTVKSRIHRAHAHLAALLQGEASEPSGASVLPSHDPPGHPLPP